MRISHHRIDFGLSIPPTSYSCIIFIAKFQDNPSEKDINQGTLVVFNLDASVSNDDLRQIFGAYGEVKEVRVFRLFFYFFPLGHPGYYVLLSVLICCKFLCV